MQVDICGYLQMCARVHIYAHMPAYILYAWHAREETKWRRAAAVLRTGRRIVAQAVGRMPADIKWTESDTEESIKATGRSNLQVQWNLGHRMQGTAFLGL